MAQNNDETRSVSRSVSSESTAASTVTVVRFNALDELFANFLFLFLIYHFFFINNLVFSQFYIHFIEYVFLYERF